CRDFIVFVLLCLVFFALIVSSVCDYNTTCKCPAKHLSGTFCGDDIGCNKDNVYECPIPGSTTCEYGPRDSCKLCGKLVCKSQPLPSTSKPPSTTACNPACVKPNTCVNAKCVCQSSNCSKGQKCDSNSPLDALEAFGACEAIITG
ncbi:12353_t:CDS:2, partial [Dentiscutata erythropus]